MYTHEKDNLLRQYLKQKANPINQSTQNNCYDLDQLLEVTEVFNVEKMQHMIKTHDRKSNLYRNHQRYIDYLDDTAGFLALATVPHGFFEKLDALLEQFPNFTEVVAYYSEQLALAQVSTSAVFAADPLLITGRPGIGKTAFCHALAKIIHTHFELINVAGMTAGFVIGGMSSNWSDGKPGRVIEALARGHRANPLIVIDEIDKAGGDNRYDPLGALYPLLENETSVSFVDEGLEMPVDCSRIVWVSTANELDLIAEPIISRFTVIDVKAPTPKQMENVLRSIYSKIRQKHVWGFRFSEDLSPVIISKIIESGLEPRILQRELISACGKAVLRNSMKNQLDKRQYEIIPSDFNPRQVGKPDVKIGFL